MEVIQNLDDCISTVRQVLAYFDDGGDAVSLDLLIKATVAAHLQQAIDLLDEAQRPSPSRASLSLEARSAASTEMTPVSLRP